MCILCTGRSIYGCFYIFSPSYIMRYGRPQFFFWKINKWNTSFHHRTVQHRQLSHNFCMKIVSFLPIFSFNHWYILGKTSHCLFPVETERPKEMKPLLVAPIWEGADMGLQPEPHLPSPLLYYSRNIGALPSLMHLMGGLYMSLKCILIIVSDGNVLKLDWWWLHNLVIY